MTAPQSKTRYYNKLRLVRGAACNYQIAKAGRRHIRPSGLFSIECVSTAMTSKLYNRFIKPASTDSDQAEREIVLNFLLVGVFILSMIALVDTLLAPVISKESFHPERIFNNSITALFVIGIYMLARYKRQYRAVALILTLLIASFACYMVYHWGLLLPTGILLCSLAIVMAGILISARSALYVAAGITVVITLLQYSKSAGNIKPDLSWMSVSSTAGDVIGFSSIFFTIALVSWLFNRQMELSLKRAHRSEKALQRQRDMLEIKVEKRARQLEEAQLERMQQLYRFAELGQLSTALFHDLANHLSTVNLDIEGISGGVQPDIMRRIQQNVGHINDIVRRVRQQIGGKHVTEAFNLQDEIKEVVKILEPTAEQAQVVISVNADKSLRPDLLYKGDATRFRQVILNLICNGIEAYPATQSKKNTSRTVNVILIRQGTALLISVKDQGSGVSKASLSKIFKPFYTTKPKGIGIGLFVVKQIVENDLNGTISVESDKGRGTTFTINLPRTYYARTTRR